MGLLEKHFDLAFAAPDGIKKLRELILTLAMQGKLVPQDPKDQPASELLKEIEVEKKRLVKEGKIKQPKPLSEIEPEEVPYTLPRLWQWSRFGDIFSLEYGDNLPAEKRSNTGEFPVYGSNGIVGSHNIAYVNSPCIVVGRKGSAGALNLSLTSSCCVTDVAYYCIPPKVLDLKFSFKLFHTLGFNYLGKGIKPGLNRNEVYKLIIGIPPLSEQRRIATKIDELMARCDELEKLRSDRTQKRITVHTAALNRLMMAKDSSDFSTAWSFITQHFSELYSVKENVAELRKAILQLAVMGKLVPQDPNDEPASELLNAIGVEKERLVKEGKIKQPKPLPDIKPEEVPYKLPDNWNWVRLGEIGEINPRNLCEDDMDAGFVPMPLIFAEYGSNHNFETRKWSEIKRGYTHFVDGDVAVAKITPCFENGKSCIFSGLPNGIGAGTTELHVFRNTFNSIYPNYLLAYFKNPRYIALGASKMTGSAGQKRVPTEFFTLNPFPLPPLAEQRRIVATIDQLMALCDYLEKQIDNANSKQTDLLNAVMAQV